MEQETSIDDDRSSSQIESLASTDLNSLKSSRSEVFIDACDLAQQGHYEKAKIAFLRVESDRQEYSKAQYLLGCACNKLDEYDQYKQAIAAFDLAIQSFKDNEVSIPVDLYYQKGFAHWKLGTYDDAIKNFSRFIRKKGKEDAYNGYLSRALVYCSMGHYEEALSDLNQANEDSEQQTAYSLCCRGRTLAHLGQYEKAKEDFQAASHIDPQDFQSHLQLGIIYSELGEYSQALAQFNRAVESVSISEHNRAEVFFRQALVYQSLGNSGKATSMLLDAVALNPKHARAYFRLGRAYLARGKYADALEALNTAQTLAPHDRDIIYELGTLHERAERLNLALHERRRAIGLRQPELPRLETPDSEKAILVVTPTPSPPRSPSPSIAQRRRQMNPHLASALEQEELLPMVENRLASYYKTLEEYKLAIASGECPEARAFMALCQEAGKDYVDAFDSMEQLYDELQNDPDAYRLWLDCLKEFKNNTDLEKLSPLVVHRYSVMERIQTNLTDIEKDHETFKNDSSQNRILFYDTLRKRLGQSLVAFSVTGCDVSVVAHNLEGPLSNVAWVIKYIGKATSFVPNFGSVLSSAIEKGSDFISKKDYNLIQDKLSLISGMGDHTDFFAVARQVAREISDRYKTQLLRLATGHTELSRAPEVTTTMRGHFHESKNTDAPADRVANFASKYVIETIRDQNLIKLGFSRNPKTKIEDLADILINIICFSKANLPRRFFKFTRVDVNRRLPIQPSTSTPETHDNHWILYDFFRAPSIKLGDGTEYAEAPWMNPSLYGHRTGTQIDVDIAKKEIEDILAKKCV